jgi:hypothetical protein
LTIRDETIKTIIPIKLKSFEQAIKAAREEQIQKAKFTKKERTSHSINNKILMISLFAMSIVGSTYYVFDSRPEIFYTNWLALRVYGNLVFHFLFTLLRMAQGLEQ